MARNIKIATGESLNQIARLVDTAGIRLKAQNAPIALPAQKEVRPAANSATAAPIEIVDEELFISAMNGVPRARWRHRPHPASQPAPDIPGNPATDERKLMQAAFEGGGPNAVCDHPEYIEGWVGVAGKRFLPNLRNGVYSIQGHIDLHGLTWAEAQIQVDSFIGQMSRFRACCVKIIHGRGINSPTDRATLKEELKRFLATRKMSRCVLAYASAPLCDGGVGAIYVLLSRH